MVGLDPYCRPARLHSVAGVTNSRNPNVGGSRDAPVGAGRLNNARVRRAFDTVKNCIVIFGVVSAVVLAAVAAIAFIGGWVTTFMWVRAGILLLITPVFYRLTVRASQGVRKNFDRLRLVTTILPVAIVVVDLIPGLCPAWYAGMQALSAVPLVAIAVIVRRHFVNAAFADAA